MTDGRNKKTRALEGFKQVTPALFPTAYLTSTPHAKDLSDGWVHTSHILTGMISVEKEAAGDTVRGM